MWDSRAAAPVGGLRAWHSPIQAVPEVFGRLKPQDREDDDGGVEGGHAIDQGDGQCVLLTVVPGQT